MKRIKVFWGYTVAVLCTFVVLATFIGNESFAEMFVSATGVVISPIYTGGEVIKTIDHGDYKTMIHRPVFEGILLPSQDGFVQINWVKVKAIPDIIVEDIDFNGDAVADFHINYDTKHNKANITPYNSSVVSLKDTYILKDSLAVRVILKNVKK